MARTRLLVVGIVAGFTAVAWIAISLGGAWRAATPGSQEAPASRAGAGDAGRKIRVTLFYVAEDGLQLVGVEREVPYGASNVEQARHIIEEQLALAPEPLVSALPEGTSLRTLFVTEDGSAFVDLSREVVEYHTGGSLDELFTVYTIVNALATNLPVISSVQILIEGREVETLAGHIDLRHPLAKSLKWVRADGTL